MPVLFGQRFGLGQDVCPPPPKSLSSSVSIARMCSDFGRCVPIVECSAEDFLRRVCDAVADGARVERQTRREVPLDAARLALPRPREHFRVAADRRQRAGAVPAVQAVGFGCLRRCLRRHVSGRRERQRRGVVVDREAEAGFVGRPGCRRPFRSDGRNGNVSSSDGPLGSTVVSVEPVIENRPRSGAKIPPNASHGFPPVRRVSRARRCLLLLI